MKRVRLAAVLIGLILVFVLGACGNQSTPTPAAVATPVPAIPLTSTSAEAKASASIVPAQKADLAFSTAGRVHEIAGDVGFETEAGDVLASLDAAAAIAGVAQAEAALQQAQAHLSELEEGPRPQEIAAAQARVDAMQSRVQQLKVGARAEEISAAQAEVAAAEAAQQQLFNGPSSPDRVAAQAAVSNAEAAVRQAQAAYDKVSSRGDVGMLPESRQLQEATNNLQAAQANYDALFARPTADKVAAAKARVEQARAVLNQLRNPATADQIAEAEAQVRSAQAELELMTAGARTQTIAAAAAMVAEAEARVQIAQAALDATQLIAPFVGTVTAIGVHPGEMAQPGQVVLTLADLGNLRVETTDLSERDVARLTVGQPAEIFVEALNAEISGRVASVAPQANVVGGDVVYTVVITLDEQLPGLRWGMSADTNILEP